MTWLGRSFSQTAEVEVDDQTLDWQQWVVSIVREMHKASASSGLCSWKQLSVGLEVCVEIIGSAKLLANLTGLPNPLLSKWRNNKQIPSFERMLELCYALDIFPLQMLSDDSAALSAALKETGQIGKRLQPPHAKSLSCHPVDRERALALIQAVLDGRETPLSVRQLEHRLGVGSRTLVYHFPQECALITARYQVYRAEQARQRMIQKCDEVRQTTIMLYAQRTNPSARQVSSLLSDPDMMRTPEGLTTWHAARRELGLE